MTLGKSVAWLLFLAVLLAAGGFRHGRQEAPPRGPSAAPAATQVAVTPAAPKAAPDAQRDVRAVSVSLSLK